MWNMIPECVRTPSEVSNQSDAIITCLSGQHAGSRPQSNGRGPRGTEAAAHPCREDSFSATRNHEWIGRESEASSIDALITIVSGSPPNVFTSAGPVLIQSAPVLRKTGQLDASRPQSNRRGPHYSIISGKLASMAETFYNGSELGSEAAPIGVLFTSV
jgi:hypothetical protein